MHGETYSLSRVPQDINVTDPLYIFHQSSHIPDPLDTDHDNLYSNQMLNIISIVQLHVHDINVE